MWVRTISQRYEGSRWDWYVWCRRTGWGNQAAAAASVAIFKELTHGPDVRADFLDAASEQLGWLDMLEGRPDEALEHFRRSHRRAHQFWPGVAAMMLASHRGDVAGREELMKALSESADKRKDRYAAKLLELLREGWGEAGAALDLTEFRSLADGSDTPARLMGWSALAQLLFDTGRSPEAQECLVRVLREPEPDQSGYLWAWVQAWDRGLDPVALRGWPAPANRRAWPPPQTQPPETEPNGSDRSGEPQAPAAEPPAAPV
jgi:tetratricopeptide (TPR) repeat protein